MVDGWRVVEKKERKNVLLWTQILILRVLYGAHLALPLVTLTIEVAGTTFMLYSSSNRSLLPAFSPNPDHSERMSLNNILKLPELKMSDRMETFLYRVSFLTLCTIFVYFALVLL